MPSTSIRMTDQERARWKKLAKKRGMKLSQLIRHLLNNECFKEGVR